MSDIDAREFGKLEAQVEALQKEMHSLSADVKALLELANKGKGGFWMGMTIASFMGGIVTFVADRIWK
jgi:DNA anti-recombination protein RmuC